MCSCVTLRNCRYSFYDNVREIIKKTKYFGLSFTIFVKKLKYFNIFFALAIELNQAMQAIQAKSNNASAKRPLASLMRGRLSWLLLAAALQGSASTRSPERRELDVVVG